MHDDTESFDAGHLRLSRRQRQAWLGGAPVKLGGRAFDLLCVLIDQGDALLHKHQLLDRVWPQLVVEENNLHTQIKALRQALGAGVLATVPGRGYRFTLQRDGAVLPAATPIAAATPPLPSTPLLGRDADAAALSERLRPGRCVTLAGPAGVGKTALAQWVAVQTAAPLVDLMPLQDAALLPALVGQCVGVSTAGSAPLRALALGLSERTGGLVIDNAEHLAADVADLVQAVLAEAPGLWLLITSQVPLHLGHEEVLRLAPLPLPAADADEASAAASPAVQLFVDAVRRLDRRFELLASNVGTVVQLCRDLDGLPLALRLAAARVPLLGLQAVLQQLQAQPARLLAGGPRDAAPRHASLQAALDWSVSLLAPSEQAVLARLGVLPGPFTLELAAAAAADASLDEWSVIEALATLVDRSLLEVHDTEPVRYRLLDSVRAHARSRLGATGQLAAVCGHVADLLQRRFGAEGERNPVALARLCADAGRPAEALGHWVRAADRAAEASRLGEVEHHLMQALDLMRRPPLADDPGRLRQRVDLLLRLGSIVGLTRGLAADVTETVYLEVQALSTAPELAEARFVALFNRTFTSAMRLRVDAAAALLPELADLAQRLDDPRLHLQHEHAVYSTVLFEGRLEESLAAAESGYRRYRPADSAWHCRHFAGHDPAVCAAGHAALTAWLMGRYTLARHWKGVLLQQLQDCGHLPSRIIGGSVMAWLAVFEREVDTVRRWAGEWHQTCRRVGIPAWTHNYAMLEAWAEAHHPTAPDAAAADRIGAAYSRALALGTRFRMPSYQLLWVESLLHLGRVDEGLQQAEACLQSCRAQRELVLLPWLLLVRAQLKLLGGDARPAAVDLEAAVREARALRAGAFELKAALQLARLRLQQGEPIGAELPAAVQAFGPDERADDLDAARALLQLPGGAAAPAWHAR